MTEGSTVPLSRRVVVASSLMIALRFAFRSVGFVSTLILVHLLQPTDFGVVGLATAVFSLFDMLTGMSMQAALVRLAATDRRHMDTAWTMNILRGLIIGLLLAASAGVAADWMHDPRVRQIIWVLAATSAFQGLENIGMTEFRRSIRFARIFQYQLYGKLLAFCVTVTGAWIFHSYWSLVAGIVASRLFMVSYSYAAHPYRPRLSLAAFRELFHFSKWFMATNVLMAIESYTATLLFGRIGGASAVGLYQVSWQVGSLPIGEVFAPVREPLYAAFARSLGDLAAMRRQFVNSLAIMLMLVCPMSIGLALVADLIWPIALGAKWGAASELIQLCALYALFDSVGHYTHSVFIVLDRQRRLIATYAPFVVLRFGIAIFIGLHWGMVATVWTLTATALLSAVVWIGCVLPLIDLRLMVLLRPLWRTFASSALMAAVLWAWLPLTSDGAPDRVVWSRLLAATAIGTICCILTQVSLWCLSGWPDGPEMQVMRFLDDIRIRGMRLYATVFGAELP